MNIKIGTRTIGGAPYLIDPTRHINVIGGSGVGKSSLLETIFTSFCREAGGMFLDPHGDVADRLPLLIPKHRRRDIVFLDPDANAVPPLNPLYFTDPEQLELAKETCLTILKALAGSDSAWGNATPYNIRNDLDAVCESVSSPTLVHVFRFLVDDRYRDSLLDTSSSPFVKLFKQSLDASRSTDTFMPATNKLAKLMRPNILSVIGWPESFDLLDAMNSGKIIICRLSKGRLGEETAQILYSLIVSMVSIAALKREKQASRPPFLIVADEAQNAVHGGRFGTLLAEARKYGISLCTAFQGFYQVPFRDDILTNAATQIVFNCSGEDAETMSRNWNEPDVQPIHISELSRYEFYARTFENDQPIVRKIKAPPNLKLHFKNETTRRATFDKVVNASLERWGVRRHQVESEVQKVLS
jgi:TraM recognition site of TraD and TraG/Helicase HerA, central domain